MLERALNLMQDPKWGAIPQNFRLSAATEQKETQAMTALLAEIPALWEDGRCLVLTGATGNGKSYAMWVGYCAYRVSGQWGRQRVLNARELPDIAFDKEGWNDLKTGVKGMLGIDDLGAEHISAGGWSASKADELMDYRYMHRLPTIITTNLSFTGAPSEFEKRYGARVVDRLREWGRVVPLTDKSLRGGA